MDKHAFTTVGIYITPPPADRAFHYDFYKACGYNYLEFCDGGFGCQPEQLPQYYRTMSEAIEAAHRRGLKVWILLLAGMRQVRGPVKPGEPTTFCALDEALLRERLGFIETAVRSLPTADGFEFFAGDPGGDPEGRTTVRDCLAFAEKVKVIVNKQAPRAGFAVNLWAIAEWAGFPSPFSARFWRKQVELSRDAANSTTPGKECGIVFSLDNYYRSLTLACFEDAHEEPVLYPTRADVAALRKRGVTPLLGWPYFLVDEIDDGFISPNNVASGGQSQAETRYIRDIVNHGLSIGLDGLVTNAAYVEAEQLNIACFARMCREPGLTAERFLDDFSAQVATPATRKALAQVLRFIENHSNWQWSLPTRYRLPNLPCRLADATEALAALATVEPIAKSPLPLPEKPAPYLERLRRRLGWISEGKIGGVAPIVHDQPGHGK